MQGRGRASSALLPSSFVFFILEKVSSDLLGLSNQLIDKAIGSARAACSGEAYAQTADDEADPHRFSLLILVLMYGTVVLVLLSFSLLLVTLYVLSDADGLFCLGKPLALQCPLWLSCGASLLLVANLLLFLVSNLSIGATVLVNVHLAGAPIRTLRVFDFTLAGSIIDMWESGGWLLAIIIGIFSGVWPYVKLFLTLAALWAPPALLSVERREYMLRVLDALGKWSLVDVLMILMVMVAFNMHIVVVPGLPPNETLADVRVEVVPEFGALGFAAAVVLSLGLTQTAVRLQRATHVETRIEVERHTAMRASVDYSRARSLSASPPVQQPPWFSRPAPSKAPALPSLTLGRPSLPESEPLELQSYTYRRLLGYTELQLPKWMRRAVLGSMISSICVHGTALVFDIFTIHIQGLAAIFLGEQADVSYSVLSLGVGIPDASPSTPFWVMLLFQVFYLMICALVPILWLFACIFMWLTPLLPETHRSMGLLCESAHAWAAIDVLLLVNIAALLQLDGLAQMTIGDKCALINEVLEGHFSDLVSVPKCFGLQPSFDPGYWLLTASTVLGTLSGGFVMHCSHAALDEDRMPLPPREWQSSAFRMYSQASTPSPPVAGGRAPPKGAAPSSRQHEGAAQARPSVYSADNKMLL